MNSKAIIRPGLLVFATVPLIFLTAAWLKKETIHSYQSVKIGQQTWMTDNLDVSTFRNGDTILHVWDHEDWEKAGEDGVPAWCYYKNDPAHAKRYGKMYNGWAVLDPRGLAPEGWHIPSKEEWNELDSFLGKTNTAVKLKSRTAWLGKNNGTNETGFSAFGGGWRRYDGDFRYRDSVGFWYSSDAFVYPPPNEAIQSVRAYDIRCESKTLSSSTYDKAYGFSVRCIMDDRLRP